MILAALSVQVGRDTLLDMVSAQGLLQIAFGLASLDRLARFVPQPVLAGFMNGIVLLVLMAQLHPLLGLLMNTVCANV